MNKAKKMIDELTDELRRYNLEKKTEKSFEQRQDEKVSGKEAQWKIIKIIQKYMLTFAVLDFILQVFIQLPLFTSHDKLADWIGLRKVFEDPEPKYHESYNYLFLLAGPSQYEGERLIPRNFRLEVLNCLMISLISLQSEIFDSAGYQKFCTQKDGSMDLLVNLSYLKARSMAYTFNNYKIRKIVAIQKRKEIIVSTVKKVQDKLKRWRAFTRTTIDQQKEIEDKLALE